jgi:cytochrome c oxidase assembly protein subunit 11
MTQDPNKRLALKLLAVTILMFGFGYALVPMYDVFCEAVGLNGRTGRIAEADVSGEADLDRTITVTFDSNVNPSLPWKFAPAQRSMKVHPGRLMEAVYYAENTADRPVVGRAVPSVAPAKAAAYFNKTECFCFTEQVLAAGERREMPVRFIVDPDIPAGVTTLTLSYTFFEAPGNHDAATAAAEPEGKDRRS